MITILFHNIAFRIKPAMSEGVTDLKFFKFHTNSQL